MKSTKPQLYEFGVKELGLFGSYLHNNQSSDSDIDLLIEFEPEQENYDNFIATYDLLENLFVNEKIEVVTKNGLSPYIGPHILKNVLYV